MVLGSTPELVDLLVAREGLDVALIDHMAPAVSAMRGLGQQDWDDVGVTASNWLDEVSSFNGKMDVICGDNPFIFLKFSEQWCRLLERLYAYLAPNGRLLIRGFFKPEVPFNIDRYFHESLDRDRAARPESTVR